MGVLCDGFFSSYNGIDGTENWLAGWMQKNLVLQVIWHPVIVRVHMKTRENGKMQSEGLLDLQTWRLVAFRSWMGCGWKRVHRKQSIFVHRYAYKRWPYCPVCFGWSSDGVAIASSPLKFYSNLFLDAEHFFVILVLPSLMQDEKVIQWYGSGSY